MRQALDAAEAQQKHDRAALDEMQSDPLMLDANRIDELTRGLAVRQREMAVATTALSAAVARQAMDANSLREYTERADAACAALAQAFGSFQEGRRRGRPGPPR